MKKLLIALPLLSSLVSSLIAFSALANPIKQNDDFVQLVGPYMITTEQAQKNVIQLNIPYDSVGIISLQDVMGYQGGEVFLNAISNHSTLSLAIAKDKKTVFIDNDMNVGKLSTIAINTNCGTSISVTVHSITNNSDINSNNTGFDQANAGKFEDNQPKLTIYSLGCNLSNKKFNS